MIFNRCRYEKLVCSKQVCEAVCRSLLTETKLKKLTKIYKSVIGFAVVALPLLGLPVASAAGYPERPITLVVPFSAGGSTDTLGRIIGQSVSEKLGQPVIVDNKAGSGGVIAADYVRRQKSDGYTFMLSTDGILSVNPSIYHSLPYDSLKDFDHLTIATVAPVVLLVGQDSPFKTAQEIIDYAKANGPGKLTFGSAGVGTSQHISGELFNQMAGIKITHVPYKGGSRALNDVVGGHISMTFGQVPSGKQLADAGKVRILGIGSPQRNAMLPDVATFDELGLRGFDSDTWYGFSLPAGVDPDVRKKLSNAILEALKENASKLEALGFVVVASSPEKMTESIVANTEKWKNLIQGAGLYRQQ